jgi:hypothetical protein
MVGTISTDKALAADILDPTTQADTTAAEATATAGAVTAAVVMVAAVTAVVEIITNRDLPEVRFRKTRR